MNSGPTMEKTSRSLQSSQLHLPCKVKHQPWYQERIDTKYKRYHKSTNTTSWTFIKDGMDDYRDGDPSKLDDSIVIKRKGVKTNLSSPTSIKKLNTSVGGRMRKKLSTYEQCFSKSIPNQQRRMKKVRQLEKNVSKSPLADVQLADDLPPNVIKDIQEILNLNQDEEVDKESLLSPELSFHEDGSPTPSAQSSDASIVDEENNPLFGLGFLYKKQSSLVPTSDEALITEEKETKKMSGETKVEIVTEDFCDWVKNIDGGPENNIEEETIKELFVCAYEGGPARSAVQTMNLSRVPSELLEDANWARNTCIRRNVASRGLHGFKHDKITYGAWYLDPKTWRARPANEKLQAEKKLDEKPKPQVERDELDELLPTLHSAQTFYNFTEDKKYSRKPEILRNFLMNPLDGAVGAKVVENAENLPTIVTD